MSEEIKKMPVDIADKDLDKVAAGAPGDPIGGIDVGLRKRPAGQGRLESAWHCISLFVADRLRSTTSRLGYGKPDQDAAPDALDELSEDLMETVSLGSRRFDNLLKRVS